MYKAAERKAKVKKSFSGQDLFGIAHGVLRQSPQVAPQVQQVNDPTRSEAELDEYFDALSVAATTKKGVL